MELENTQPFLLNTRLFSLKNNLKEILKYNVGIRLKIIFRVKYDLF